MTKEIAENLLTSIIVETNSFRLPATSYFTFKLCSDLAKTGVDFADLTKGVYWAKTKESAILSGICLSRCRFLRDSRIAWSLARQRDFRTVKGKDYDIDAVASEMCAIEGVEIAVLFREKSKRTLRVSLRSKGRINVAGVAEKYNGGGHSDIAGCYIPNNKKSMRELLSFADAALAPGTADKAGGK